MLRGCSLKNTKVIYGVVTYTGHETKIMMNSIKSRPKQSTLEKTTNELILWLLIIQVICCLIASIIGTYWKSYNEDRHRIEYLHYEMDGE